MIQSLLDGVLVGSILSLGAIGLTMAMHMLRFANFAHAELLSIGAYAALVFDGLFSALFPPLAAALAPLSLTWALALAIIVSMVVTAASAILVDRIVFARVRAKGGELSMVFASFGVALVLRNLISLIFGLKTQLYSQDIVFAVVLSHDPFLLVKPDQVFALVAALVIMLILHLVLSRTTLGFSLRAVAENPTLAQVSGIRLSRMIALIWIIGAALAAAAGVFYGLTNQISPVIGRDLVLPIFAATIVGGIGSIYGAVLGGFLVGIASNLALVVLPSGYSPAVPFLIILAVLLIRPNGLVRRGARMIGLISYLVFFTTVASILAIAVLGLNLQWGNTGLFNGGVVAFFGAGGLCHTDPWRHAAGRPSGRLRACLSAGPDRRDGGGWPSCMGRGAADPAASPRLPGDCDLRRRGRLRDADAQCRGPCRGRKGPARVRAPFAGRTGRRLYL